MLEPKVLSPIEIEAFRPAGFDAVYADDYEPRFPGPVELLGLCVLIPLAAAVRGVFWAVRKVGGAR